MELHEYDEKHVLIKDIYGGIHKGVADYDDAEYCRDEYGTEEEALRINGFLLYRSQIASIELIEVHGTAELRTERLKIRRYCPEDAEDLYKEFGTDPDMYKYSGWNPYATKEMAEKTVQRFIDSYSDEHFYGWVMDCDDVLFGTIGAYDYHDDQIEVGFSVVRACWGRGYGTEALQAVLSYLTENEGIGCVTAWCARENIGSARLMEKAGMKLVRTEKNGLEVNGQTFDKLIYEYHRK